MSVQSPEFKAHPTVPQCIVPVDIERIPVPADLSSGYNPEKGAWEVAGKIYYLFLNLGIMLEPGTSFSLLNPTYLMWAEIDGDNKPLGTATADIYCVVYASYLQPIQWEVPWQVAIDLNWKVQKPDNICCRKKLNWFCRWIDGRNMDVIELLRLPKQKEATKVDSP